jgi:uncharacterized membrane protein (DUF441 family)
MLTEAAGLAVLAGISPTALMVVAIYLGSARPRVVTAFFLAGALTISVIMAIVVLVIVRGAGLNQPSQHAPRYGLRLGLGIVLLTAAVVVAAIKPRGLDRLAAKPGLMSRLIADPAPSTAFVAGMLVYLSGLAFIAALQAVDTARAGVGLTILATAMVVVINVCLVWLPLTLHELMPQLTERRLKAFNNWLRVHGKGVLVAVFGIAGMIMTINGGYGVATR